MINFACRQVRRALLISWFESLPVLLIRVIVYLIGVASLTYLATAIFVTPSQIPFAFSLLGLSPTLLVGSYEIYVRYLKNHPEYLNNEREIQLNVLNGCDYPVIRALMAWKRRPTLSGLLVGLTKSSEMREVLYRLNLPPEISTEDALVPLDVARVTELIKKGDNQSKAPVSGFDVLHQLIFGPEFSAIRAKLNLRDEMIDQVFAYYKSRHAAIVTLKDYWLKSREHHTGGFAKDWATSFTPMLDQLASEIPAEIDRHVLFFPLFSRERLVAQAIVELNKQAENNVLLIGEPGSGRTEIFYHLASQIIHHETNSELDGFHVRVLDVQRLFSAADSPSRLQQLLDSLFAELVRSGNSVLFIDRIDLLLNPSTEVGSANLGKALASYLENSKIKIVGTTTKNAYLELIKSDQTLSEAFGAIEVAPPAPEDLLGILLGQVVPLENRYRVFFTVEGLDALIRLASRYIKGEISPSRELRLMEEVAVAAHAKNLSLIGEKEIAAAIEKKVEVPIQVDQKEQSTLMNLEQELHKRVVGQERPIKLISEALMRSRAGLGSANRPVGAFLFLGPTGVGKTETAKTLAERYYGSESKMVRLDMTEYADVTGLQKLLGTNEQKDPGALALAIQKNLSP
ncbi:MAG TPA: AAA family ATPase, partial [Candidatus Saccharimonadales bacterium]|nr:AAA family ATPase [Candidatus Saccharimonadales bacterium]